MMRHDRCPQRELVSTMTWSSSLLSSVFVLLLLLVTVMHHSRVDAANVADGAYQPTSYAGMQCAGSPDPVMNCSAAVDGSILRLCLTPLPPYHTRGYCGLCSSGAQGAAAFECGPAATIRNTPLVNDTRICAAFGLRAFCPAGTMVTTVCGALSRGCLRSDWCNSGSAFGIVCSPSNGAMFIDDSCEWRHVSYDGIAACEVGEVMTGTCLSGVPGSCGGSPFGSSVRCCANRTNATCAPRDSAQNPLKTPILAASSAPWTFVSLPGAKCANNTVLTGFCAVRCDPFAIYGFRDNPGMFSCSGWTPTQTPSQFVTVCAARVECPTGYAVVGVEQCYELPLGPGTRATCARLSFATLASTDDARCLELTGDDFLWCPRGYAATSICGPNRVGACPSGFDGELRCCPLASYHSLGQPCPSGLARMVMSASAIGPPGHGIAEGFPASLVAVGAPVGVATCGQHVFISTTQNAVVKYSREHATVNVTMGTLGSRGFEKSEWSPDLWSDHRTVLDAPSDISVGSITTGSRRTFEQTSCARLPFAFVDSGNHMIRGISVGLLGDSTEFLAEVVLGAQSTSSAQTFTDPSSIYLATLPPVFAVFPRRSDKSVFVGTFERVIRADAATANNPSSVRFAGGGSTRPPDGGTPRNETLITAPFQFASQDDAVLYLTDRSGGGGVVSISLTTGVASNMPAFPAGVVPGGIAFHLSEEGRPSLFVAGYDSHAVYRLDLPIFGARDVFVGVPGQPGGRDVDGLPRLAQQLSGPGRLAVTPDTLYVVDGGNDRLLEVPIADVCAVGQSTTSNCLECDDGFFGYPRCRRACSNDGDCSSRAVSITGDPDGDACECTCEGQFSGRTCSACASGRDPQGQCQACLPSFFGPTCMTRSESESVSESPSSTFDQGESPSATASEVVTITITPPPTRTPTDSNTKLATPSIQETNTDTLLDTNTASKPRSRTRHRSESESLTLTDIPTSSDTPSQSPDTTATATESRPSASLSFMDSPTSSLEPSPSLSTSRTRKPTPSLSPTESATVVTTVTRTLSNALVPPTAYVVEVDDYDAEDVGYRGYIGGKFMATGPAFERSVAFALVSDLFDPTRASLAYPGGASALAQCARIEGTTGLLVDMHVESATWAPHNGATVLVVTVRATADDNDREGDVFVRFSKECIHRGTAPADAVRVRVQRVADEPVLPDRVAAPLVIATQSGLSAAAAVAAPAAVAGAAAMPVAAATLIVANCHWATAGQLADLPLALAPLAPIGIPGVNPRALRPLVLHGILTIVFLLLPIAAAHYATESDPQHLAGDGVDGGDEEDVVNRRYSYGDDFDDERQQQRSSRRRRRPGGGGGGESFTAKLSRWGVPGRPLLLIFAPFAVSCAFLTVMALRTASSDTQASTVPLTIAAGAIAILLPPVTALGLAAAALARESPLAMFRRFTVFERPLTSAGRQFSPIGCWIPPPPRRATSPSPTGRRGGGGDLLLADDDDAAGGIDGWPHAAVGCWWSWSRLWWAAVPEVAAAIVVGVLLGLADELGCRALTGVFAGLSCIRLTWWLVARPHVVPGVNLGMAMHCALLTVACGLALGHTLQANESTGSTPNTHLAVAAQALVWTSIVLLVAVTVVGVATIARRGGGGDDRAAQDDDDDALGGGNNGKPLLAFPWAGKQQAVLGVPQPRRNPLDSSTSSSSMFLDDDGDGDEQLLQRDPFDVNVVGGGGVDPFASPSSPTKPTRQRGAAAAGLPGRRPGRAWNRLLGDSGSDVDAGNGGADALWAARRASSPPQHPRHYSPPPQQQQQRWDQEGVVGLRTPDTGITRNGRAPQHADEYFYE